jgi:hypothetical protein
LSIFVHDKFVHDYLCAEILSDGRLLLGANYALYDPMSTIFQLMRFRTDGSVDPSFKIPKLDEVSPLIDLALLPDGKYLTADYKGLARWNADGMRDTNFFGKMQYAPNGFTVLRNQHIVASDDFGLNWFTPEGDWEASLSTLNIHFMTKYSMREAADGSLYVAGTTGGPLEFQGIWRVRVALESYQQWATRVGLQVGVQDGSWETFLGDGVPNFARYAFVGNLSYPAGERLEVMANGNLRLKYNSGAGEGTFRLKTRADLNSGAWTDVAVRLAGQNSWTAVGPGVQIMQSGDELVVIPNKTQWMFFMATVEQVSRTE